MTVDVIQFLLRLLLAVAFAFMGVTHFLPKVARTMTAMIPPRLRGSGILSPKNLVIFTGVCELAGAVGLLFPPTIVVAGIGLILFLVAVFPANAHAAGHKDRFGAAAMPLIPRLIGQIVLIALLVLAIV